MKPEMIVMGNWKMNLLPEEAAHLSREICIEYKKHHPKTKVALVPPFPYLKEISKICDETGVYVGAQNVAAAAEGAYTGEVSAAMIKACGAQYVLIGHSERRQYFHEDEKVLRSKMDLALGQGMSVVYCVGETLEQRRSGRQFEIVGRQLNDALMGISVEQPSKMVIAYEPVWAIGTGEVATPQQAGEVHTYIRRQLVTLFPQFAAEISILYGGSVKKENAAGLFAQTHINGALVGGASLNASEFFGIILAADGNLS
jgi:triosephosphate isomerase